jgi:hypothetical protein
MLLFLPGTFPFNDLFDAKCYLEALKFRLLKEGPASGIKIDLVTA